MRTIRIEVTATTQSAKFRFMRGTGECRRNRRSVKPYCDFIRPLGGGVFSIVAIRRNYEETIDGADQFFDGIEFTLRGSALRLDYTGVRYEPANRILGGKGMENRVPRCS